MFTRIKCTNICALWAGEYPTDQLESNIIMVRKLNNNNDKEIKTATERFIQVYPS